MTQPSDRSEAQSLRFQPGQGGNPQKDTRDLVEQLRVGMGGLTHLQGNMFSQNSNPNIMDDALESL